MLFVVTKHAADWTEHSFDSI